MENTRRTGNFGNYEQYEPNQIKDVDPYALDLTLYFPHLVIVCQCNSSEGLKKVDIESVSLC
jgi:hypothetical protein